MGDTWNDATQSYENENQDAIAVVSSTGELVENGATLTDLIKLNYDFPVEPNIELPKSYNIYIWNDNNDGEIRFYTKDAKNNNDYNQNYFNGSYTNPRLNYNTKIGKDGKLSFYHSYTILNPPKLSGWYELDANITEIEQNILLLNIGTATNTSGIIANGQAIIDANAQIALHTENLVALDAYDTTLTARITALEDLAISDASDLEEYIGPDAEDLADALQNRTLTNYEAQHFTEVLQNQKSLYTSKYGVLYRTFIDKGIEAIGIVGIVVGIFVGIKKILDDNKKNSYQEELVRINDSLAGLPLSSTNKFLIHTGLTIVSGNSGFTTAGVYRVIIQREAVLIVNISASFVASILNVELYGISTFTIGESISIPKTSLGGGTGGNLVLSVASLGTLKNWTELRSSFLLTKIEGLEVKSRRKLGIIGADDINTSQFTTTNESYTNTTEPIPETITYKQLKSRLNLLPTGGGDVDIYTATGSLGIGTTPLTNLDTYHISDNILRLGTATNGQNSIEFKRGTDIDVYTDLRFLADTSGYLKLQYEDDAKAYGDTGTNIIWGGKDNIILHKETQVAGNVGIGTAPLTNLHIYGATANTLLLETGTAATPIIEFRKGTTSDTATDWRFIADAGGIFKFQFNNNTTAFGATANASDIWNARTDRMVIYKNTTISLNCGIGGANPHATYKLNVGGDVNIPAGSAYRIGTNPLSYNDLADQLVAGQRIDITNGIISSISASTRDASTITGLLAVEHGGTGRNDIGMYAIPFGNADETAYTWTGDFKYNQALGRLGVNVFDPAYALDVNGDVNIPATSNYRIGGNPLSYNDLANKLTAGTNIDITSGVINANVPAQLTAGTGITITSGAINATTQLSAGTNITITSGVISAIVPAQLTAGTGITITSGAINATTQLTAGTNITITSGAINAVVPTTFDAGAITSGTLALSRGGTGTTTIGNGTIPYGNATQTGYTWNNLFKFDATNTRLAINKGTPLYTLDVGGDINIPTGTFYRVNGTALTFTNLSGTCPVSKGGTGLSVVSTGAIIFGNITSDAYSYRVVFNWDDVNLRLGVNKTSPAYTIDSGGDINIPFGSVYRINGVALSYNNLTNKLTAGTNVEITAENVVNVSVVSISASAITSGTLGVARGGTGNATFTAGNILYGNDALAIGNNTSFKYLSGRLGVNMTGTPVATLHIGTGATSTAGTYYVWFDYFSGSSLGFANTNMTNVCAYLQGSLWLAGGRFLASSSDIRIKQEIEDINDDSALQMILAVEPKTYKYIDKPTLGDKRVYGFIAQQIREVIPEAINLQKETIPNILLLATYNEGIITLPSQPPSVVIKVGDKLRCYDKENKEIIAFVEEVAIANDTFTFRIAPLEEPYTDTRIFIYGTEIDDFHTIDKNYIYTLNVCATQELHRKIVSQEQRIVELEAKVERLLNYLT